MGHKHDDVKDDEHCDKTKIVMEMNIHMITIRRIMMAEMIMINMMSWTRCY